MRTMRSIDRLTRDGSRRRVRVEDESELRQPSLVPELTSMHRRKRERDLPMIESSTLLQSLMTSVPSRTSHQERSRRGVSVCPKPSSPRGPDSTASDPRLQHPSFQSPQLGWEGRLTFEQRDVQAGLWGDGQVRRWLGVVDGGCPDRRLARRR